MEKINNFKEKVEKYSVFKIYIYIYKLKKEVIIEVEKQIKVRVLRMKWIRHLRQI